MCEITKHSCQCQQTDCDRKYECTNEIVPCSDDESGYGCCHQFTIDTDHELTDGLCKLCPFCKHQLECKECQDEDDLIKVTKCAEFEEDCEDWALEQFRWLEEGEWKEYQRPSETEKDMERLCIDDSCDED